MSRALLLVAFGLVLGASVTYLLVHVPRATSISEVRLDAPDAGVSLSASASASDASDADAPGAARPRTLQDVLSGRIGVAERAAVYELALRSDAPTLRSLLREVAAMPPSEGRRTALEALIERYAEIEPRAAVAAVQEYAPGTGLLAAAFAAWAGKDASGALDALRDIQDPGTAEAIGIALLPVLGNDDLAITRIAGSATSIDPDRLRVEALAARAESDPASALDEALTLPASFQPIAFERIAAIWVRGDVEAALRRAGDLPPGAQAQLRAALLRAWSRSAPDAALAYVRDLDASEQMQLLQNGGFDVFRLVDPAEALELARELPGEAGRMARTFAIQNLAATDPLAAVARIEQLPPGPERDQLLSVAAAGYARVDPEAALAWAQSLRPPQPNALLTVLSAVARTDPDRALDIALSLAANPGPQLAPPTMMIAAQMLAGADDPERIANRILSVADRTVREQTLSAVANAWSVRDPAAALRWLVANADRVPARSLLQAGQQLARSDPAAAFGYTSQIPNELRAAWLGSVAAGYAQNDPESAMSWVGQYQGQAGYESAVAAIVQQAANYDPAVAARLLESMPPNGPGYVGAVSTIAYRWGSQSPREAAQWASDLRDATSRRMALSAVLQRWSVSDPAAARAWALAMPEGDARDAALVPVVASAAQSGETIDHTVVDAFGRDEARRQALLQAVALLARRDQDAARRLADEYLSDPSLQTQVRQLLEAAENPQYAGGVSFPLPLPVGISSVSSGFASFPPVVPPVVVAPAMSVPPRAIIRAAPMVPLPPAGRASDSTR